MFDTRHDLHLGRGATLQFVGNEHPRSVTQALEEHAEKAFRRLPVPPTLHENIEHMAILVDCAPQVIVLALDGKHHLVKMPFVAAQRLTPAQRIGISLAEFQRLLADRLIHDDDVATGHELPRGHENPAKTGSRATPHD